MKIFLRFLSFILFISLLLLASPLYSWAEEEVSTQTTNIQIHEGKEIINVSIDDIKDRLLKSKSVHFVKEQEEVKRTIKAELITNALKKEYGIEKIDIKNAIITGDIDFHIKENLVDLEGSGVEVDEIKKKSGRVESVYLISPSINIKSCQLQGNLKAGYDRNLKSIIIFKKSVAFSYSTIVYKADFSHASFNGEANFRKASFNGVVDFWYASFNDMMNFTSASFKEKAYFSRASFKEKANFREANFNGEAYFGRASFKDGVNFVRTSFKEGVNFVRASFNGGTTNFSRASFKEKANFRGASFKEGVNFVRASFNCVANFESAIFEKIAIFREGKFKEEVLFSGTNFVMNIDLIRVTYPKLRISWSQLKGLLDGVLHDSEGKETGLLGILKVVKKNAEEEGKSVDEFIVESKKNYLGQLRVGRLVDWKEVYLKLVKNFEDIGDAESAHDCYYHYRYNKPKFMKQRLGKKSEKLDELPIKLELPEHLKNKINYKNKQLVFKGLMTKKEKYSLLQLSDDKSYKGAIEKLYRKSQFLPEYIVEISPFEKQLEHIFFGLTCGYGVRPFNALGVGLVLIISFTLFYFIGCQVFPSKKYLIYQSREEDFSTKPIHHKLYNCFYFSVTTFTTVGYGDLQPRGGFKVAAMVEGFLGWMTMALFLVTLGNVWLR